ncbi:DNA mismatch repair endonuclease MutL, partial [Myxococcota bacterium]|nr:DNA mismatch repair endonuclease MutL [Myxococcota bacterium]
MGRIQVLDDILANQIAAGEVVERPASAAKEILENALDAGATTITIEIADGGIERLRVVDNGEGMSPEDATLALKRHATSKLNTFEQLQRIATLGFRGEALPSIASVSRLQIRTRTQGAVGATRVIVEGGEIKEVLEAPGPVGTEILIEDLFYNVPARRKFLKKGATEATHIHEIVQRMALCNPGVGFRFIKDGRTSIDLPSHATLSARVNALFGPSVAEPLRPVEVDGAYAISGLIGPASAARGTARHYYTFINGRFISDKVVRAAIQAAYGQRLERGRHPFVILHLQIPPEAVDVNVHPAKTEVRFVDSGVIHRLVTRAIDEVLTADPWTTERRAQEVGFHLTPPSSPAAPPARAAPPAPEATRADSPGAEAHRKRIFD